MTPQEEWRPVVGYEDCYEVSSLGKVRSLPRSVKHRNTLNWIGGHELKINHTKTYPSVQLSKNGSKRSQLVHLLVLKAFAGPCPPGCKAMFKSGNKSDCSATNLRWARNEDFRKSKDPSPDEIRAACDSILDRLSPAAMEARAVQKTAHWKIPVYGMPDMPEQFRSSIESINKELRFTNE